MSEPLGTVFLLFCLLQIKHMFADYFLQTPKMLSGRGTYWHMGRAQHAGVHVLGSALCFLPVGTPLLLLAGLLAAEWVVHFNIDFWKASHSEARKLDPSQAGFWRAVGIDQCLHHLTYVAMVWFWVSCAA